MISRIRCSFSMISLTSSSGGRCSRASAEFGFFRSRLQETSRPLSPYFSRSAALAARYSVAGKNDAAVREIPLFPDEMRRIVPARLGKLGDDVLSAGISLVHFSRFLFFRVRAGAALPLLTHSSTSGFWNFHKRPTLCAGMPFPATHT